MRVLTIINLVLWTVLFVAWLPYAAVAGIADSTSLDVLWILVVTAGLLLLLGWLRIRGNRPILG